MAPRSNRQRMSTQREAARPMAEQGVSGVSTNGGYVVSNERNASLNGATKWVTFADLATNVSIVAASLRFFTALVTKATWSVNPVDDSAEAQKYAEIVERMMRDVDQPWAKIVRRAATFRFWGFSTQEWSAIRRDDGVINFRTIGNRPQSTIEKWDLDDSGEIIGIVQNAPLTGLPLYVPRQKLLYLVDDLITDSPEGTGFLRHCAEPAAVLRVFEQLERQGFERDLRGIPIGRAPIAALEAYAGDDPKKKAQVDAALNPLRLFVTQQMKGQTTGLLLDSQPFEALDDDGNRTPGAALQWGMELLNGPSPGLADAANAIMRRQKEMARIMGTEGLLLGSDGSGSLALSEDKTSSLLLNVNSTVSEIRDTASKDLIDPLWKLNGYPDEMKPEFATEEISHMDAAAIAAILRDMATAGAVLDPTDPAIDEMRELIGFPKSIPFEPPEATGRADLLGDDE